MFRACLALLAAFAALVLAAPAHAQAGCPGETLELSAANRPQVLAALTCLVNEERGRHGLPGLARDARLDLAAQRHADDMARRNYFDHTSPEGSTPLDRAVDAGYPGWPGENIAMGAFDGRAVMLGWMASPGHCANILGAARHLGLGLAPTADGGRWVQLFGGAAAELPGAGTACPVTLDYDRDGVPGGVDNCGGLPNPDQRDADGDGMGDVCDESAPEVDAEARTTATIRITSARRVGRRLLVRGFISPRRTARVTLRVLRGTRVVSSRPVRARSGRFRTSLRVRTTRAVRVRATTARTTAFTAARTTRRIRAL